MKKLICALLLCACAPAFAAQIIEPADVKKETGSLAAIKQAVLSHQELLLKAESRFKKEIADYPEHSIELFEQYSDKSPVTRIRSSLQITLRSRGMMACWNALKTNGLLRNLSDSRAGMIFVANNTGKAFLEVYLAGINRALARVYYKGGARGKATSYEVEYCPEIQGEARKELEKSAGWFFYPKLSIYRSEESLSSCCP